MHQRGQLAQAKAFYEQVIRLDPNNFDGLHMLGVLEGQGKNPATSLALIDRAIGLAPDNPAAHSNRGLALQALARNEEALVSYDRALALKPDYADACYNRGNALLALKRHTEAVASYDRALALKPDYAQAFYNRGNALLELNRLEDALASYNQAIALKPDYAIAHSNRGHALQQLDRMMDALASYDRAIALQPNFAGALWNKSLTLLMLGQFRPGWALYESRWKKDDTSTHLRPFKQPLWLGQERLEGRTILLHAEQGLGDTLQFCRYAPLIKAQGATVLLEVQAPLAGVLGSLKGVDRLIVQGQPLPAFDLHCPLLSLPLACATELSTIPCGSPYLFSDPGKRQAWAKRLGAPERLRVGLTWSGRPTHKNDRNRSLALCELLPHLPEGCEYISLQKEIRDGDLDALKGSVIQHHGEAIQDFSDTAALCDLVDVVVSVDTSVAHLAAALGKPTWVLLPHIPDWRWLLGVEYSPWYESVRLYRQDVQRQWAPVLQRVAQDLQGLSTARASLRENAAAPGP